MNRTDSKETIVSNFIPSLLASDSHVLLPESRETKACIPSGIFIVGSTVTDSSQLDLISAAITSEPASGSNSTLALFPALGKLVRLPEAFSMERRKPRTVIIITIITVSPRKFSVIFPRIVLDVSYFIVMFKRIRAINQRVVSYL